MELKWLEDLLSVAELGHFSRAAQARHVTQSALSRRIKSLELWVGAELLDRSRHPIELTQEGEEFIHAARDIVVMSREVRSNIAASARIANTGIRVACLHTLALAHIPAMVAQLREVVGSFEISIVAETRTVEEYLTSLANGSTDLFISYTHPSVPFDVDPADFPSIVLGTDTMVPYHPGHHVADTLSDLSEGRIPYLKYSSTSFMSHVVDSITAKAEFRDRLRPMFQASLAESLLKAARHGLGMGWMPLSLIDDHAPGEILETGPLTSAMTVRAYKSASNETAIVNRIWDTMPHLPEL